MQHFAFTTAAMLLCAAVVSAADPMAQSFAADAKKEMPGAIVSKHVSMRVNLPDGEAPPAPIVGSMPMAVKPAPADCAADCRSGHGIGPRLRDWFCYQSSRPGECTLTPTSYRPPLYTYFPCKGIGAMCVAPTIVSTAAPVTPIETLPPPKTTTYGGSAAPTKPVVVSKPQPLPQRLQGPLLPGSAAAANIIPAMSTMPASQDANTKRTTNATNPAAFYSPSKWNELQPPASTSKPIPPAAGYPRLP
jgi:hypothetical protein